MEGTKIFCGKAVGKNLTCWRMWLERAFGVAASGAEVPLSSAKSGIPADGAFWNHHASPKARTDAAFERPDAASHAKVSPAERSTHAKAVIPMRFPG